MPKKINLAIIFGGKSGEHEISLKSAKNIIDILDKDKYNIVPIAITKKGNWLVGESGWQYMKLNMPAADKEAGISLNDSQSLVITENTKQLNNFFQTDDKKYKIDLVLPILHGPFGEDGKLQGLLDMFGIPYVFSGTRASAVAMNKQITKILAKQAGLLVLQDLILKKGEKYNLKIIIRKLSFPIVIKPMELGSSVGMSIAKNAKDLKRGIKLAFKYDHEIMLEKFIKGRELTVAIYGNNPPRALPVVEIIPKISDWFDYKAKYEDGGSDEICPAKIPGILRKKIQTEALQIYKILGCKDLARADFIWQPINNKLYFLEINTIPGLSQASLTPKAAQAAGMNFKQFIDKLIKQALKYV